MNLLNWLKDEKKLVWLIILSTIALRIPTLCIEIFNGDEANFGTTAMVILNGGIPYVDFLEKKPPLIYYIYAFTFKIFTTDIRFVHFVTLLFVFGTEYFLFKTISMCFNKKAGLLAALFYGLFSIAFTEPDMWAANTEILMNFPLTISIYLFVRGEKRKSLISFFLSGLFLMLGTMIKHQGGILYILFIVMLIYYGRSKGRNQLIKDFFQRGIIFFIGSLIPIILIIIYFNYKDSLKELYLWNIFYNFSYITESPDLIDSIAKGLSMTFAFILSCLILWILAFYFYRKRNEIENFPKDIFFLFLVWLLVTIPAVSVGSRFFGHYYILFYPSICVLGGLGAWHFLNQIEKHSKSTKKLFLIGLVLTPIFFEIFGISRLILGRGYQAVHPSIKEVGSVIQKESKPDDKIFAWGQFPYAYYYSKRLPASKFIACEYVVPLWNDRYLKRKTYKPEYRDTYQINNMKILMEELNKNMPKLIIDVQGAKYIDNWVLYEIKLFPELNNFIKSHYKKFKTIEGIVIYKRSQ
ncbi:MAG: glycosyltransferase family 39 protein [Spirochaetota bacterium]|nr:glycosyltransferase family 39 protein [Spirochaetota bacterium]